MQVSTYMDTTVSASNTRQRLLDAAAAVFAEKGLVGATTREISHQAQVNEVTLFRHFQSKEKLLAAVLQSTFDEPAFPAPTSPLDDTAAVPGHDLRSEIRGFAHRYERVLQRNILLLRTLLGEIHRHREHEARVLRGIFAPLKAELVTIIQRAQDAGNVRADVDPVVSADVFSRHGVCRRAAAIQGGARRSTRRNATWKRPSNSSPAGSKHERCRQILPALYGADPRLLGPLAARLLERGNPPPEVDHYAGGLAGCNPGGHRHEHHQRRAAGHPGQPRRDALGGRLGVHRLRLRERGHHPALGLVGRPVRTQELLRVFVGGPSRRSSVLCGLAPNLGFLIAARVLQGIAGGGLLAKAQSVVFESFAPDERGAAQAIFGLGVIAGPALGPVLGGWLTDHMGWRWIFFHQHPVRHPGGADVHDVFPGRRAGQARPQWPRGLDRHRPARARAGELPDDARRRPAGRLVRPRSSSRRWRILAVVGIVTFVWWELRIDKPAVDLRVLRHRSMIGGSLYSAILGMGIYGIMFAIPVFVQDYLHYTATQSGVLQVPGAIASAVTMILYGKLLAKYDPRLMIGIGA